MNRCGRRVGGSLLRAVLAATIAVSFGGCARSHGVTQPPGSSLHLFDGFEEDSIAAFWLPGDYGSGRYAPGAVAVSRTHARTGGGSLRVTVKEGDVYQVEDDGQPTERAELDSGRHPLFGQDVWLGFSFLIPEGFPVVENRLVIAQWKQSGVPGSPLVGQRYRAGRHYLTIRDWGSPEGHKEPYPLPEVVQGSWNDMVNHLWASASTAGLVEVWMNGAKVVSHCGPTASASGKGQIYHKIGLYRDRWQEPMTIYFDNYTLGDSFAAVDPSRFDRAP
jgi:polysaccharide lyase-like protein